ncbi:MarR family winged helix-turn-helix transcriptional regulator [Allostreptomyces psammosilenae]|uniref:DNA-binding MarR family transcriptional regulator n=1 Tax=Allostreptomyces psammosilenae TaxID=1892865 RepID=A0A852ZQH1_9ACTN|nr:MarR family transcriptional regulator [Allostreptomyces psammosilenae]NYI04629.1 DNA-binding MarR family transcriptional regulator [Allostreptomyces psammosilenae]
MASDAEEPDLGMLIGQLARALRDELFARLAEQGHPRVRPRHGTVLAVLPASGARATELAQWSGQHKQIVGVIVDELEELGYVRRESDPRDRRAKLVVPTANGLDGIDKARAILADIEQRHRAALGDDTYAVFRTALEDVTRAQRAWQR